MNTLSSAGESSHDTPGVTLLGRSLSRWDSRVLVSIKALATLAKQHSIELDLQSMPTGMATLLRLSNAVAPLGERRKRFPR